MRQGQVSGVDREAAGCAVHVDEPTVQRVAPEALDCPTHGRVYLVYGSLMAGAPVYEPDAERAAAWAQRAPERERQARRFRAIQTEIERERMKQLRLAL